MNIVFGNVFDHQTCRYSDRIEGSAGLNCAHRSTQKIFIVNE